MERGTALVAAAQARGDTVVVAVFDLDRFKALNDTAGHDAGDHALEAVASALQAATRGGDVAARTGGDEFVLAQVLRSGDDPIKALERVRDAVEHEIHTRVADATDVGVTAGLATTGGEPRTLLELMNAADAALVEGKRQAKGRVYAR